ncbi:MAG: hypothetical protein ABIS45_00835, partial [Burkholderiales bacterium]
IGSFTTSDPDAPKTTQTFTYTLVAGDTAAFTTRSANAAALGAKLAPLAARTEVLSEAGGTTAMRAYPRERGGNGAFVGSIAELARRESWQLDEIHVEEGRLDEVFRSITLPDTVKGAH